MIALLQKLITEPKQRILYTAALVVAANAGEHGTPIGDVTTTMLWIADTITSAGIMKSLFLPSIISLIVFGAVLSPLLPKQGYHPQ